MTSSNPNKPFVVFVHFERQLDEFKTAKVIVNEDGVPFQEEHAPMLYFGEVTTFTECIIRTSPSIVVTGPTTLTLTRGDVTQDPVLGPSPKKGNLNAFLMKKQKRRY